MKTIKAHKAPKLRRKNIYPIALLYATLITIVTVGQLFSFDVLVEQAIVRNFFGGMGGVLYFSIMAAAGVLALPYLLRMYISKLMRAMSAICATVVVPFMWCLYGWWLQFSGAGAVVGIFGGAIEAINGHALALIVGYASVGLAVLSALAIGLPIKGLRK